ncbi:MAG TPA: hypothetical protein VL171_02460, partial [Verrucomicrobiae bacterium]|nr:hypothetical protein [Verrucomicrobiae bacterium]
MYTVELYARVRRAVLVNGMSERETAREFGLARETVRKMLRYSVPPGYQRQKPVRRPKLDQWVAIIDRIPQQNVIRERVRDPRTSLNADGCGQNRTYACQAANQKSLAGVSPGNL